MADHPSAIVVGGGPAGLMAAELLAAEGIAVTVHDHRRSVGRKLVLAGRSGLNLTHAEPVDDLLARYNAPTWLRPYVDAFTPEDLRAWASSLGVATYVGSTGRVFPESFTARPLLRAWLARLGDLGVEFEVGHRWLGWTAGGRGHRFEGAGGVVLEVEPDVAVLALGGASWPRVASDGGWVGAFADANVEVTTLRASNAGMHVAWSPVFAERFAGVPLKNVAVSIGSTEVRGDVTVTTDGLESGPIYALGPDLRHELDRVDGGSDDDDGDGAALIEIDLHPDLTTGKLADRLRARRPKDSVATWLRRTSALDPVAINLLRDVTSNDLPADPAVMAALIKAVPVRVTSLAPIDRAISTAGGVARHELTDELMLRRRPGTFVAGEMIDWDAPTGGYLLQACFSTGVAAARGALKWSRAGRDGSRSLTGDVG